MEPLPVARGDRVGVVLLYLGGPDTAEDVLPFLYNLFMDPAVLDLPCGGLMRSWLSRAAATLRCKSVRKEYEAIGGSSPVNRLAKEQAESLEALLNSKQGPAPGVAFRTYVAMRYWHPYCEETALRMQQDGINKVVLLPLFPQYSKTTTGSTLAYWQALERQGEIPSWPTTCVVEYAAHPKYVQAVSERIDEALQRFPRRLRDDVPLLFSAYGTPLREMKERGDPHCCLIHDTVDRVMAHRRTQRPYQVAFHGKAGPAEWLTPATSDALNDLARRGHTSVLVVPIALVTEHLETTYVLDIVLREQAAAAGMSYYEVMPALNCHPLFIQGLAEALAKQLALGHEAEPVNGFANGYKLAAFEPPVWRTHSSGRCSSCAQCRHLAEARRWTAGDPVQLRINPSRTDLSGV